MIAPWLSTTPRLDDAICEKRNATETDAALKRLLRIAEHESGNFHSAPESSSERPNENFDTCAPELPRPTSGLELKEEIANVDTPPHPAETYVASEADIATMPSTRTGTLMLRRIGRPKSLRGTWTELMSGICGLVPTLPSWRMKLQAQKTSWSAIGYGWSA